MLIHREDQVYYKWLSTISRINIAANAWTGLDNILAVDDVSAEPHFSESVEGIRFKYKNTETMLKAKVEDDKLVLYKPDNALFREGFIKGITYNIDLSDSSLSGYHFAFSTTSDGGYNGGVALTEAVDADEVALSETTLMVNIPKVLILMNYIITPKTTRAWEA